MTAVQILDRPVVGRVYPRSVATFERVSRLVHEWSPAELAATTPEERHDLGSRVAGKVLVGVSTVTVFIDPQA